MTKRAGNPNPSNGKNPNPNSRSKGAQLAAQREDQAWLLRRSGCTFPEIAAALQISLSTAHAAYKRAELREQLELGTEIEGLRTLWASRYDRAVFAIWEAVKRGEPWAIRALPRLGHEAALLQGLHAPRQVELSGPGGGPISTLNMSRTEYEERMRELPDEVDRRLDDMEVEEGVVVEEGDELQPAAQVCANCGKKPHGEGTKVAARCAAALARKAAKSPAAKSKPAKRRAKPKAITAGKKRTIAKRKPAKSKGAS